MHRAPEDLPLGRTSPATAAAVLDALRATLDGGAALAPRDDGDPPIDSGTAVPEEVGLLVRTSGSTGRPRSVLLDRDALLASAGATHERLGGPGQWVLALPLTHVAGLQVLVRSVLARTEPVVLDLGAPFTPAALAAAVAAAPSGRTYASLVPTQLHRLVAALRGGGLPPDLAPLTRLDAILVGGAGTPGPTLAAARAAGLRVVTTYGMTETCGGCVYDGVPLTGVRVALDDGVVRLGGTVLARGYLDGDDTAFTTAPAGGRWFRTRDAGHLQDGRLTVTGRVDDVLISGGVNVAPAAVEGALATLPGVEQVCVVGLPDAEWGTAVTAVVVTSGVRPPDLADARALVARTLGAAAAPRHLLVVAALPLRGPGKPDRAAVTRLAAAALRGDTGRD